MSAGAIDSEFQTRMTPTLEGLERLRASQDGNAEVSVPGVVVVGAQSAGKSSVLEAITGIKLPRGQNITTRVPPNLSLQNVPGCKPHALIGSSPDSTCARVIDFTEVGQAIEGLTSDLAGDGAAVNEAPIYCWIKRDSGPTLTLTDLPGITHMCADDRQDIHTQTVSLVNKYIQEPNMVILVVVPAMEDFANAEGIKLAKAVDPDGRRTLGVVTKMDNIQPGCNIAGKLRMDGKHVKLHLGFVAVINRTPVEVEKDTPAKEVRARERHFFQTNPEVAGLEQELWGLPTLVARIVDIQMACVQQV